MNERTRELSIVEQEQPKMYHGHTRIELTSVVTGEKKVVEHDNTFQSAFLEKQLRAFGSANGSPWNNSGWTNKSLIRNLCGGIFLFRDAITAPCEYMPSTNLMVANSAYGVSNSGTPVEMGSYNSVESSIGSDSAVFVYDWNTSQGNGTIGCVCLTSEVGGYIGYGNSSGVAASTKKTFTENQTVNWYTPVLYNGNKYMIADLNLTNKTFTVNKRVDDITKTSVFTKWTAIPCTYTGDIVHDNTNRLAYKQISNSKIAISNGYYATIGNGSTGRVLTFDCSNETVGYITIVNTSGKTLLITSQNSNGVTSLNLTLDSSGNIYCVTTDGYVAKFNSSGVFVDFVSEGNADGTSGRMGKIVPDVLMWTKYSTNDVYLFDGTSEKITNGAFPDNAINPKYIEPNEFLDCMMVGDNDSAKPYKNPMYLATINNLDSAVTKDNTQTMKVIYTLTET